MNANLELLWRMSGAQTSLAVAIDQRPKPERLAANDRNHQRQSEHAGANKGARRASDPEPNRQRVLKRAWVNSLPGERSAVPARPLDMRVLANLQKQIELLGKERIVVLEVEPEERKRLNERAATGDDL